MPQILVQKILAGDTFRDPDTDKLVWVALSDATIDTDVVHVKVQFADGGITIREWDIDQTITVS